MQVFNDLKTRGGADRLIAVTDARKGLAEALRQQMVLATSSQRPVALAAKAVAGLIPGLVLPVIAPLA